MDQCVGNSCKYKASDSINDINITPSCSTSENTDNDATSKFKTSSFYGKKNNKLKNKKIIENSDVPVIIVNDCAEVYPVNAETLETENTQIKTISSDVNKIGAKSTHKRSVVNYAENENDDSDKDENCSPKKIVSRFKKSRYKTDTEKHKEITYNVDTIIIDDSENILKDRNQNSEGSGITAESGVAEKPKYQKSARIRQRNEAAWFKNIKKKKRNSGQSYQYKKGNNLITKEARKVGRPCTCQDKCYDRLGMDAINTIHTEYWAIADYDLQTANLQSKMERVPTKRSRVQNSRVEGKIRYTCTYKGKDYVVCKTAFLQIHDIGRSRAWWAFNKKTDSGVVIKDQRGKKAPGNKFSEERVNCVHEHIQNIPVRASHYTRSVNHNRQYVDCSDQKSIAWLHERYKEWMVREKPNVSPVNLAYYNTIFSTCYNIEFRKPKRDTCDTCDRLNAKIDAEKKNGTDTSELESELKIHKVKASVAYRHLNNGQIKELWPPEEWHIVCIDLQQTYSCPKVSQGSAYYKRKLNVYNFCVHDVQKKEPHFFLWEEYTAHRGSCEIYSCLFKYIERYVLSKGENYPKKLRIMTDNCGGQNKNNHLCLALLRLVHLNIFHRIELAFLVPGHSYMPCDTGFGKIERNISKSQEIASPKLFGEKIANARKKPFPFYHMTREDFLDIDIFTGKKNGKRLAHIRLTSGKVFKQQPLL